MDCLESFMGIKWVLEVSGEVEGQSMGNLRWRRGDKECGSGIAGC